MSTKQDGKGTAKVLEDRWGSPAFKDILPYGVLIGM